MYVSIDVHIVIYMVINCGLLDNTFVRFALGTRFTSLIG